MVLADGYKPSADFAQSIRESLRGQIAPYKIPHNIEFAESLPKSAVGKILRAGLIKPNIEECEFKSFKPFNRCASFKSFSGSGRFERLERNHTVSARIGWKGRQAHLRRERADNSGDVIFNRVIGVLRVDHADVVLQGPPRLI